jgi:hypothetical protein
LNALQVVGFVSLLLPSLIMKIRFTAIAAQNT